MSAAPNSAAADGWIEWAGGECPVRRGTLVEVQLRHGGFYVDHALLEDGYAEDWAHDAHRWDNSGDIIAYRLVQS